MNMVIIEGIRLKPQHIGQITFKRIAPQIAYELRSLSDSVR